MSTLLRPTKCRSAGGTTAANAASASVGTPRVRISRAYRHQPASVVGPKQPRRTELRPAQNPFLALRRATEALLGAGPGAGCLDLAIPRRCRGHELREKSVRRG